MRQPRATARDLHLNMSRPPPLLHVEGDVDARTSELFARALVDLTSDRPGTDVTVDAGAMNFIGIAGMRALIQAADHQHRRDGRLTLAQANETTWRHLALLHWDTHPGLHRA
ncbi:STAS domain-containing protein [Spirillospora sp. NPDC047279]|uniref:STAS domain-containing protein n=1 Tax=Spirillospora sp. NPDC047279 TaxID=3155478 RepID=UPI00340583AD